MRTHKNVEIQWKTVILKGVSACIPEQYEDAMPSLCSCFNFRPLISFPQPFTGALQSAGSSASL